MVALAVTVTEEYLKCVEFLLASRPVRTRKRCGGAACARRGLAASAGGRRDKPQAAECNHQALCPQSKPIDARRKELRTIAVLAAGELLQNEPHFIFFLPGRVKWLSLAAKMLPHRALPDRPTCTTRRSGVRALSTYLRLETKGKLDGPPPSNDRLAKECAENRGREGGSERNNARRCIESESRVRRTGRDKSEHALWHGSVAWLSWRIVRHSRRHSFRCICVLPSGETGGVPTAPSLIHQIHPSALLNAA